MELVESLAEALARASTILPDEVVQALRKARDEEEGPARVQLEAILKNVEMAKRGSFRSARIPVRPRFSCASAWISQSLRSSSRRSQRPCAGPQKLCP